MSLVLQLYRYSLKVVRPVFANAFVLSAALPNLHSQDRRPDTSAMTALSELAADFEKKTDTLAPEMRLSFRLQAAQALLTSSPELSQRFVDLSVDEIKQSNNIALESGAILALAATAPAQASTLISHLQLGADQRLISALAFTHHDDVALSLYREMLARGKLSLGIGEQLVRQLYTHDQTFIFDRNGKLIAHVAKEMSQQEFRELLVKAGL